jgi:eukaryotic-like serine/threonine-protein kinase
VRCNRDTLRQPVTDIIRQGPAQFACLKSQSSATRADSAKHVGLTVSLGIAMARWTRIRKLKAAGQAEIFLVHDEDGREAVMKKLYPAPQLLDPDAELQRFKREVRCQSSLEHPGIMPILGSNFAATPPWYVMPRAEKTLGDLIDDNPGGLRTRIACRIMLTVSEAVDFAHGEGVLHRDLKPENILKVHKHWVVGDFGLCRDLTSDSTTYTQSNTVVGTVAYMAPEQFDNAHDVGPEADVFSLGKILYHVLTGKCPFPYQDLNRVPGQFKYLVARATEQRAKGRYPTVAEFSRELGLLTRPSDMAATPPVDAGKALLEEALSDESEASVGQLLKLVLENSDDEVFYRKFVASLPVNILAAFYEASPQGFSDIVRSFDEYSEGPQPFSYVDVIADFFFNVITITPDHHIRKMAFRRIVTIGASHNRWYVQQVVNRVVERTRDPQDVRLLADVLRQEPDAATFYRPTLNGLSLPPAIRETLGRER